MGPSLLGFLIQSGNSVVVDVVTIMVAVVIVVVVVVVVMVVVVVLSGFFCIIFGDLFNTSLGFTGRAGSRGRFFLRWWVYLKEVTFRQFVSSRQSGMNFPLARSHSLA